MSLANGDPRSLPTRTILARAFEYVGDLILVDSVAANVRLVCLGIAVAGSGPVSPGAPPAVDHDRDERGATDEWDDEAA